MDMTSEQRRARIAELRQELDELLRQEYALDGLDHEALIEECRRLKRDGRPFAAIKHYRTKVSCGLLEARDTVDLL